MDSWNPQQYQLFSNERTQPFHDLVKLIYPVNEMTIVDLGCGTGELTKRLHQALKAKYTLGIDSSSAMLQKSSTFKEPNLVFQHVNIENFAPDEKYDLIFSNAALQWVPNHSELFTRLSHDLSPHGQIAIQMPFNDDFPTHKIARELAQESPFKEQLGSGRPFFVLQMEDYSRLLYQLGFKVQIIRAQIYPHLLESTESLIEWVKGSLLTYYRSRLSNDLYEKFLQNYRKKIIDFFGNVTPLFVPFKRILIWAQKSNSTQ
jgi:trans-aconitate 2-methyltransferase